jgi:hypothetical protein
LLTGGGRGWQGAKSHDSEKAWCSIVHLILSSPTPHPIDCSSSSFSYCITKLSIISSCPKSFSEDSVTELSQRQPSLLFDTAAYRALALETIAAFVKEEAATEEQLREQQTHEHNCRSSSMHKSSSQESHLKAAVGPLKSIL